VSQEYVPPLDPAPAPTQPRGALGVIFLIVVIDLLGFGLIIPLLPFYARQFNASPLGVTLLFSVFSLCQFVAAPVLGLLSDRVGRRFVLVFSQLGSALGYVLLAWASLHHWENLTLGLWTLYASRIIDGLSGGNISAAQAYVADVTRPGERAKGMGMLGAAFGIGFAIGPAMGGLLSHHLGPAAPAWAAAGMSVIAALMSYARLQETRPIARVESEAWLRPRQFLPILRNPLLVRLNLLWFGAMGAFVMMDSAIALFLADIFGWKEAQVGWYFLFVGLVILLVQGGLVHRLNLQLGEWRLCSIGLFAVACGSAMTASTAWQPAMLLLFGGGFVHAFGRSLFQPSISALASRNTPEDIQGASLGMFQGMGTLARATWPALAGPLYGFRAPAPWLAGAAITLVAALAVTRMPQRAAATAAIDG